jgi:serine/threonine protein kinase
LVAERYRLNGQLGSGGMGTVWRGRDERLKRSVAVKEVVIPEGMPKVEAELLRERYLREARAAARLRHPSVVGVYDVIPEPGRVWIVMELVNARDLSAILRADGPLEPLRAARIGLQLLDALEAAHEAGVLHRDVKPANVLICEDDRAVLTDFGVASVIGDASLTRTGQLIGSPAYLAPERVTGGKVGPPTDLWSLGCTLYAAVEGQPPFARDEPFAIVAAITLEPIPEPHSAGLLAPVLYGLLEKDQAARWSSARTRAALEQVIAGRPVQREAGWGTPRKDDAGADNRDHTTATTPAPRPGTGERAPQDSTRQNTVAHPQASPSRSSGGQSTTQTSASAPSSPRSRDDTADDIRPPAGRRSRRALLMLLLATILVFALAGIAAVLFLPPGLLDLRAGEQTPPPSAPAPPAASEATPPAPGPPTRTFTNARLRYKVDVPQAWSDHCLSDNQTCRFNRLVGPDRFVQGKVSGTNTLYVFVQPARGNDALELAEAENERWDGDDTKFPDYKKVRLETAALGPHQNGSLLEFTYTNAKTGPRHVLVFRTVVYDTSYEVSLNAPTATFANDLPTFENAVKALQITS